VENNKKSRKILRLYERLDTKKYTMKKSIVFILLCFCVLIAPLSISAQKKPNSNRTSKMSEEAIALHLSGFAPLGYVGGKIGADIPIKMIEKRGFKGFLAGRNFREWYLTGEMGMMHKANSYENFSVLAELTYRRVGGQNGWFVQVSPIGVGGNYVLPAFGAEIPAPSSGITSHPLLARKWYVTPSVSMGFGRDFALRKGKRSGLPLVIYGKVGIGSMLPYKTVGYLVPTGELGIGYRFSGLAIATRQVRRS
jgi:hypothetical protein